MSDRGVELFLMAYRKGTPRSTSWTFVGVICGMATVVVLELLGYDSSLTSLFEVWGFGTLVACTI